MKKTTIPTLVHDYLELSAQIHPRKTALVCGPERWTYAALSATTSKLARGMNENGITPGDRVAVFLENSSECVISIYATLKAGGVFVVLNSGLKPKKLGYILRDSGAKILIAHADRSRIVAEAVKELPQGIVIVWVGGVPESPVPFFEGSAVGLPIRSVSWSDFIERPGGLEFPSLPHANSNGAGRCIDFDLAALIYTSGSTGEPKGVMSSHFNMVAAARSITEYLENRPDDTILSVLPLSFDYGLYQVIMTFMFGGTIVLEKSFLYPVKILEKIAEENVTGFPIVPTIAALLIRMKNLGDFDLRSLRYLSSTAAVLPVEHIQTLKRLFHPARLYSMYGLTECKRVSYLPPEQLETRPSSVGRAIPNCRAMVMGPDGREVAPGLVGELVIRGANVMRGYWNAPELTAKVFRPGAYPGEVLLYSGDLFRKDEEGFLYFVGRRDDQIKTKGERVSPREIEAALNGMEGVVEAAVIGVPDDVLGQAIKCYIVSHPDKPLTEKMIIKFCMDNLEPFMIPKYVEFLDEMPKSAHGKIDRKKLLEYSDGR